jgi:hypothetical protein
MKKLLVVALAMIASYGYAQEMRLPDDKKKKYVKEEKAQDQKTVEAATSRSVAVAPQERVKDDGSKKPSKIITYCIVRESIYEGGKSTIEVETEMSSLLKNKDVDQSTVKELMNITQNQQYKTALSAINQLALSGFRVTNTVVVPGEKGLIKEYIMVSGE